MGAGGGGSDGGRGYRPNKDGHYGRKADSKTNSHVRHLPGGKEGAKKFFDNITNGYQSETKYPNGMTIRKMPDGATITYRPKSSSDGTAAVTINDGSYKYQKIHFIG